MAAQGRLSGAFRLWPGCAGADRVRKIVHSHSAGPEGIKDVDALIEELLDAGAECGCVVPEQSCRVCQLAVRKAYGDAIPFQLEVHHDPAIAD